MELRDYLANAQGGMRNTYDSGVSAMLDRLGLERQRTTLGIMLPMVAIFGAGLAAGSALGLLFAPKRGEETREIVWYRLADLKDQSVLSYEKLVHGSNGAEEPAQETKG